MTVTRFMAIKPNFDGCSAMWSHNIKSRIRRSHIQADWSTDLANHSDFMTEQRKWREQHDNWADKERLK